MSNIQESIFKAIDVITDKKLNDIKFDKTIECIIESATDAEKGKYSAKYQDIIFNVYSNNNTVRYSAGTNVYVLVPQGDFSNKKTIIGKIENTGEEFISIDSIIDKIETIDRNYVTEPKGEHFKWEPGDKAIKELSFANDDFVRDYAGKLNLLIGGMIKTNLKSENGNFGMYLDLTYETATGKQMNHQFTVDLNSMVGNPYSLDGRYQYKVFPLLNEKLVRVNGMYLFVKNFTGNRSEHYVDFSSVEVLYAKPKDAADLTTFSARMKAEKGTIFKNGWVNNDTFLTLEMIPEKLGKPFKPNAVYKWFFSDSTVVSEGEGWDADGGIGWRFINPPPKDKEAEPLKKDLEVSQDGKILTIRPGAVPNLEIFKCVAIFGGEKIEYPDGKTQTIGVVKVEAIETIIDQSDAYSVIILSSNGDVFKASDNIQTTELTCKVFLRGEEMPSDKFIYKWTKFKEGDKKGEIIDTPESSEKLTVSTIRDIINTESYVCEVFLKNKE